MAEERTHIPVADRRLQQVVAEYQRAVEAGRLPDRQALRAQHPELAEEPAAFFQHQDAVQQLTHTFRPGPSGSPATIRYFGDYEIHGELGRGAMGAVFRARQVSLNRPVALKMILAGELAGEAERQRFRLEAEAAANLDHPHNLPIYEVGDHAGRPYFSMKLVDGPNLSRAMSGEQWPVGGKDRLCHFTHLVGKVARAVQHAHQRGILHRDLGQDVAIIRNGLLEGPPHRGAVVRLHNRPRNGAKAESSYSSWAVLAAHEEISAPSGGRDAKKGWLKQGGCRAGP